MKSKEVVSVKSFMLSPLQMKQNQYPTRPATPNAGGGGSGSGGGGGGAAGPEAAAEVTDCSNSGSSSSTTSTSSTTGGGGAAAAAAATTAAAGHTKGSNGGVTTDTRASSVGFSCVEAAWMLEGADDIPPAAADAGPRPMYAIDCEMVQTAHGQELVRMIDSSLNGVQPCISEAGVHAATGLNSSSPTFEAGLNSSSPPFEAGRSPYVPI